MKTVNLDKQLKPNELLYSMDFEETTEAFSGKKDFNRFLQLCVDSSLESSKTIFLEDLNAIESATARMKDKFGSRKRVHIPRHSFIGVYIFYFMLLCSWPLILIHHYAPYYYYQQVFLFEVTFIELLTVYIWLVSFFVYI
jgi:hypothetical protein